MEPSLLAQLKRTWSGKRVLIAGVGLQGGGAGAVRFFSEMGADVALTDLRPRRFFREIVNTYRIAQARFGGHDRRDFLSADLIIRNPGMRADDPLLVLARRNGTPVHTEAAFIFDVLGRNRIIGITGTKGKSTTAALLHHVLRLRYRTELLGSPGTSGFTFLLSRRRPQWLVYELSNFMLEDLETSPHYALITNFLDDHRDRYNGGTRAYWKVKERIFAYQRAGDKIFLNREDAHSEHLADNIPSERLRWFGSRTVTEARAPLGSLSIGAVFALSRALGLDATAVTKRIRTFRGLEGRMQFIGAFGGVRFINDTAATNPAATAFSIAQICAHYLINPSRLIVIAGGADKRLDISTLARALAPARHRILLPGTATEKLVKILSRRQLSSTRALSMNKAVWAAVKWACRGDIVLLSPGAASFGLFQNEFDRGRAFVRAAKRFGKAPRQR